MAFQKLIQDSLVIELSSKIDLYETENTRIYRDFTALLASEKAKTTLANQVSEQQKLISQSHEKENKELRKKNRALKWQRNGSVVLGLILVILVAR